MTDLTPIANRLVRLEEITPAYEYAAYFNVSIAPLVAHLGLKIFDGYDDLDDLQFAFLTLPSGETVTLTEYAGAPGTSLCVDVKMQQNIPQIVFDSCVELRVSRSEIEWFHEDWQPEIDSRFETLRERLYTEHGEIEAIARPGSEAIHPSPEREPIDCFHYALEIYPRTKIPEYWAMLQHNLGLAYYHRTEGERWRNLQESIACFNRSLEVFTPDKFPQKWQINREDLTRSMAEWKVERQNLIRDIRSGKLRNLSYADLSGVDLSGADLSYADLSGADLRGANLSDAKLSDAKLSDAKLRGANLRDANLIDANNVENTRFGVNRGISESMKRDLIERGAIFEDLPGDRETTIAR